MLSLPFFVAVIAAFMAALLAKERRRQWQEQVDAASAAGSNVPARLSPFWRRLVAFTLDFILLDTVDGTVSALFSDPLSRFGDYRPLVLLLAMVVYFGCLESRWGGGCSVGKRLLGICVVRTDNTYLSPFIAGLRAALVLAPSLANGMSYDPDIFLVGYLIEALLSLVVLGLGLSMLYLLALSNNERQVLLQDLAFKTMVVRQGDRDAGRRLPSAVPLWEGHFVVIGVMWITAAALPGIVRLVYYLYHS